jgi:hypothetical protein
VKITNDLESAPQGFTPRMTDSFANLVVTTPQSSNYHGRTVVDKLSLRDRYATTR